MEVRFKREMNHNYMIIDAPEEAGGYECRMMAGNVIEGLLRFRVRHYEEKKEFYYEITSKQPLSRLLAQRKITGAEIRSLLLTVLAVLGRIEEYLLKEEELLLEPDYIYVEPDGFMASLCLLPGFSGDFPGDLSQLLKFLLERVDHQDRDGVVLAYNLYHESLKENYGAANLLRQLLPENDKIFSNKQGNKLTEENWGDEPERRSEPMLYERPEEVQKGIYGSQDSVGGKKETKGKNFIGKQDYADKQAGQETVKTPHTAGAGRSGLRCAAAAAGAELLIWYLAGEDGLRQYGVWAAAVALLIWGIYMLSSAAGRKVRAESGEGRGVGEGREISRTIEGAGGLRPPETSSWEIETESEEEYRKRVSREDVERMERARDEGTVLLASLDQSGAIAVLESLNRNEESIEIGYVPFVIGKHRELADHCLAKPAVSRLHLRIDRQESIFSMTDLNSTNGTTVNGRLLQANETVIIRTGDVIFIADIGFKFTENDIL